MFQLFRKSQSVHGSASQGDLYQKMHFAGSNPAHTKKIFSAFLRMNSNSHIYVIVIREADTFTSSLFTITYYLIDKFRKKKSEKWRVNSEKVKSTSFCRNLSIFGPDDRIRTCGILLPKQALYQTEPHPVILLDFQQSTPKASALPVAVPGIFLADGAASSSADRGHSFGSLTPPQAAVASLPKLSHIRMP